MKSRLLVICILCSATTLAYAQSSTTQSTPAQSAPAQSTAPQNAPAKPNPQMALPQSAAPAATPPVAKEPDVPASDPVITIHNVCTVKVENATPSMRRTVDPVANPKGVPPKDTGSDKCTEVLTRADFEKMLDTFHAQGPVSQGARQNLAHAYVDWQVLEDAALKAKMEDDAEFKETMSVLRMRVLADMYHRHLEDQLKHAPDAELDAYYQQHISKYREVEVHRMIIPKVNPTAPKDDQYAAKAEAMATEVHDRIAKGEDPDAVMKDAYTKLGITSAPTKTDFGKRRASVLGPQIDTILSSLKPGEVSPVQTESNGWIMYKLDSDETPPLAQVKEEVSRDYAKENLEAKLKDLSDSAQADYNTQYFGPMVPQGPAGATAAPGQRPAPAPAPVQTPKQ